eukprot:COSAG06_NODE_3826_length_4863_cov_8.304156_6_plen_87_part_00
MREATVDPRTKVVKITTAITVVTSLDGDAAMRCDAMRCDAMRQPDRQSDARTHTASEQESRVGQGVVHGLARWLPHLWLSGCLICG